MCILLRMFRTLVNIGMYISSLFIVIHIQVLLRELTYILHVCMYACIKH